MLLNSDRIRMMHMLDAARDAVELTSGREFQDLQSDKHSDSPSSIA